MFWVDLRMICKSHYKSHERSREKHSSTGPTIRNWLMFNLTII